MSDFLQSVCAVIAIYALAALSAPLSYVIVAVITVMVFAIPTPVERSEEARETTSHKRHYVN